MPIQFILYSTSHCHLCEQAESYLSNLTLKYDVAWKVVEITDDTQLLSLYEVKIPVLKRLDTNTEICWPFCEDDIELFIKNM